ncbi:MAG: hypothetical protein AAFN78_16360 [Pseudomonadota bacterium]
MRKAHRSTRNSWWLRAAAALLLAGAAAGASASYRYSPVTVDVLSDHGRSYAQPFAQYPVHTRGAAGEYRAFLEASRGANYAIRIRNHTGEQVGVVVAVDGRNIISGKKSRLRSSERMYVLGPYESATYRGWRTGRDRVNQFYFTEASDSYAATFNDRSAMGVIAVAAFGHKHRRGQFHNERDYGDDRYRDYRYPGNGYPGKGYEENGRSKSGDYSAQRSAPSSEAHKSGPMADAAPGTGYGETRYSPSRRVQFTPHREPFASVFLKYEWRSMLCRKGVVDCHNRRQANRLWPRHYDNGYAPAPYARSYGSR